MKMNPDLIKKLLLAYEGLEYPQEGMDELELPGYSPEEVRYHTELLLDAGFILAEDLAYLGTPKMFIPRRLTFEGVQFLEKAKDNNAWGETKKIMAGTGGFALDIASKVLAEVIIRSLHIT